MATPEHKDGLWRIVGEDWVRFVFAYLTDHPNGSPDLRHVMREGGTKTLCGRTPVYQDPSRPTDTPSMSQCNTCTALLLGQTR